MSLDVRYIRLAEDWFFNWQAADFGVWDVMWSLIAKKKENVMEENAFWKFVIKMAVAAAALAMYSKTQEVMTALAPVTLFGQTGLAVIYGFFVAALIEGVLLALHFIRGFQENPRAEGYKWFLFGVSTICQFLDQSLVKDVTHQTSTEAFFAWMALGIVPAILFGLLWVGEGWDKKSVTKRTSQTKWKGVLPMWKEFMNGSNSQPAPDVTYASDTDEAKEQEEKPSRERRVRHE